MGDCDGEPLREEATERVALALPVATEAEGGSVAHAERDAQLAELLRDGDAEAEAQRDGVALREGEPLPVAQLLAEGDSDADGDACGERVEDAEGHTEDVALPQGVAERLPVPHGDVVGVPVPQPLPLSERESVPLFV